MALRLAFRARLPIAGERCSGRHRFPRQKLALARPIKTFGIARNVEFHSLGIADRAGIHAGSHSG